jgi:hypothetical protein
MVSSIVYSLPKFLVVDDYNLPPLLEVDLWRLELLISPPSVLFDLVRSAEAGLRVLTDGCSTFLKEEAPPSAASLVEENPNLWELPPKSAALEFMFLKR